MYNGFVGVVSGLTLILSLAKACWIDRERLTHPGERHGLLVWTARETLVLLPGLVKSA